MRFYVGQCDVKIFKMPTQRVPFAGPRNNANLFAFDPVCKGPALWNFGISDKVYFFFAETR